ncbi:MAG: TIGR03808 family TAT-translocated repetitive protein, partial [Hyphomicrobium sp.]
MPIDRRSILSGSIVVGLTGAAAANAGPRSERETARVAAAEVPSAAELGLKPGAAQDQSAALQAAIDQAAHRGAPLLLPPGRFRAGRLQLRPGTRIVGTARTTTLEFVGGQAFLVGEGDGIALEGLVLDGAYQTLDIGQANALVSLKKSRGLTLRDLEITRSIANGVTLEGCAGVVSDCTITAALMAGL